MSPEDTYSILEAIAEIHNRTDKWTLVIMNEDEKKAEDPAKEIDIESIERASNFSFGKCNISIVEEIEFCNNPSIVAIVADDKNVKYNGEIMSLTAWQRY